MHRARQLDQPAAGDEALNACELMEKLKSMRKKHGPARRAARYRSGMAMDFIDLDVSWPAVIEDELLGAAVTAIKKHWLNSRPAAQNNGGAV